MRQLNRLISSRPRAARPAFNYLREAFEAMHPGGNVSRRFAPFGTHQDSWALVPDPRSPWLLMPTGPAKASAACLDELAKRGHTRINRLSEFALSLGFLRLWPRLVVTPAGDRTISNFLGGILGSPVVFSMVVGRLRALQKPVLRVISADGATVAYAKVGVSPVTRSLVRHEAAVLRDFATNPPTAFVPPNVFYSGQWQEVFVLVLEPVTAHRTPKLETVRSAAFDISQRKHVHSSALRHSPAWIRLRDRVENLPADLAAADQLREMVAYLDRTCGSVELQTGMWHGDFAPWNMAWDGDHLHIWDWEGYDGPVPCGFDMLHYRFQGDVVLSGVAPAVAVSDLADAAPSLLEPWMPENYTVLVAMYVIHLVAGLIETGDRHTRISRLDGWLEVALAETRRRLQGMQQ